MIRTGLLLLVLAFAAALSGPARAQPADGGHALVELVSERSQALAGETIYLGLNMQLDEGWHVYWRNPGDAGLPPEIIWQSGPLSESTEGEDFAWPLPERLPVVEGEIMDYGYSGEVTLPFPVTVPNLPGASVRFEGIADYLICKDVCIPETAPVSLDLAIGEAQVPDARGGALIAEALVRVPQDFAGEARVETRGDSLRLSLKPEGGALLAGAGWDFFPHGNEIVHAADQRLSTGPDGMSFDLTAEPREPVGEAFSGVVAYTNAEGERVGYRVAAAAGPAIAGTFGSPVSAASGLAGGGVNLLAIAAFALLGGVILNLMPCVLPVLSIKAFGMVKAAASGERAELRSHGLWYTTGVLLFFAAIAAVFVALRGAGEFVSLGFQLQYPGIVAALALVMFAIGLWLLGVFELGGSVQGLGSGLAGREGPAGAFATGILAGVVGAPCVGPFLGAALGAVLNQPVPIVFLVFLLMGFGLALPFLALSFLPGLHRILPKPGAWMDRLKQFFAFPMFLTAVWLLTVLADQAGGRAVVMTVLGAVLIGFGIWALKAAGGRLRPLGAALGALALLAGLALPVRAGFAGEPAATGTPRAYASEVQTEPWSPERVEELLADGKGVFVDFTATWCMICQANKRTTLTQPDVLQAMEQAGIVFLVADFTSKDDVIAGELKKRGRAGVPMYLLYGPGEREPVILPEALTPALMLREIAAVSS